VSAAGTVLVKWGGAALKDGPARFAAEIGPLVERGQRVVVVHGGGPEITAWLDRLGLEHRFVAGLRVTSPQALMVTEMALARLSGQLAAALGRAVGLSGRSGPTVIAEVHRPDGQDLGRVGRVLIVDTALIEHLLAGGFTPVINCIAQGLDGEALNVNADWFAAAIAGALRVPAVFLSDVDGLLSTPPDPTSLLKHIDRAKIARMTAAGQISGGMIPKVQACLDALAAGAPAAIIANAARPGVVQAALSGVTGTQVKP